MTQMRRFDDVDGGKGCQCPSQKEVFQPVTAASAKDNPQQMMEVGVELGP